MQSCCGFLFFMNIPPEPILKRACSYGGLTYPSLNGAEMVKKKTEEEVKAIFTNTFILVMRFTSFYVNKNKACGRYLLFYLYIVRASGSIKV